MTASPTYVMPRGDGDMWADITSYPDQGHIVPCPVDGCDGHLMWYEAGYVPGYRVCMRQASAGKYDESTIRHRFTLGRPQGGHQVLVAAPCASR